jgi:hypothetical protein
MLASVLFNLVTQTTQKPYLQSLGRQVAVSLPRLHRRHNNLEAYRLPSGLHRVLTHVYLKTQAGLKDLVQVVSTWFHRLRTDTSTKH